MQNGSNKLAHQIGNLRKALMQELINSKHSARIAQKDNDREDNID